MLNFKGFVSFVAVASLSMMMAACGTSVDNPDVTVDSGNDIGADVVDLDVPVDGDQDVRIDVTPEVAVDVVPEIEEDVIEDVPWPDTLEFDGYWVPNVKSPYADVLPKNVDWDSLPKMPSGKIFTTAYAAGVGVTSITPDFEVYLGGFGNCTANPDKCRMTDLVHDPVEARAVAIADVETSNIVIFVGIDDVGLLDFDVLGIHDTVQKIMYETFDIYFPGANAILAFSHAHSSIDTTGLWGPMIDSKGNSLGRDEKYTALVVERVAEACRLAVEDLKDSNISWGVSEFVQNYTGDPDNLDSKLWVIKGVDPETTDVQFTLTRWAAHPTTYGSEDMTISSDYPGTFRFKMERDFGGTAIFMNGPIGDTYPNRPDTCGLEAEAFPEGDRTPGQEAGGQFMKATCTGFMVADAAIAALATTTPLAETGIKVMHDVVYFHPYNDFLMYAISQIGLPFPTCGADDTPCRIYMHYTMASVGDLTFLTAPGEIFPTFAVDLSKIITDAEMPNPVVLFAQGWLGYLMTAEQFDTPDNGLDYNKGLCPGSDLYPKFLDSVTAMTAAMTAE